jgi:hypothetical protein
MTAAKYRINQHGFITSSPKSERAMSATVDKLIGQNSSGRVEERSWNGAWYVIGRFDKYGYMPTLRRELSV